MKIIGYLTRDINGEPGYFEDGVLWLNGPATVFRTSAEARAAVRKTRLYSEKEGLDWPWWGSGAGSRKLVRP